MRTVDGRIAITRKEWAQRAELSEAWARAVYGKRTENGHPETAFTIGRTAYWWQDELDPWWQQQQKEAKPEPIERTGDPDELLFADGVADLLGYAGPRTVLGMHHRGQFAEPDEVVSGAGQKSGQPRPKWKRRTVWDWADNRARVRKPATEAAVDNTGQPG